MLKCFRKLKTNFFIFFLNVKTFFYFFNDFRFYVIQGLYNDVS